MRRIAIVFAALVAVAFMALPAAAITDGELDGNGHPYVGLMVAQDALGNPMWRCSGTLISPTVFLTAGHCTEAPAAHVEIWFAADVQSGVPTNGYPFDGDAGGTPHTHPDFTSSAYYVHDVGVVVLDEPFVLAEYGALPQVNQLDVLKTKRGTQDTSFTAVGYGLQQSFPDAASWKENNVKVRMVAHPKLNQINGGIVGDFSLLLSNNARTGGTCFGDSGGPNFLGTSNVVAGVTSFGMNGNCAGTGGVFRMDRQNVLDFVNGFMADDASGAKRADRLSIVSPGSKSVGKASGLEAAPATARSSPDGGSAVPSAPKGGASGGADRGGASSGADKGKKLGLVKH